MPLPIFSFAHRVDPIDAKQDRIAVTIKKWKFTGNTAQIAEFRMRMGLPPLAARDSAFARTTFQEWGKLFNCASDNTDFLPSLTVRRDPFNLGEYRLGCPLFAGKWFFGRYALKEGSTTSTETKLELTLNPTRFVRYQSAVQLPESENVESWPKPNLFKTLLNLDETEFAYDGSDNWIPQNSRRIAFTNHRRWPIHLQRCCASAIDHFEKEVNRIRILDDVKIAHPEIDQKFSLNEVETYFEFNSHNPADVVESLKPLIQSFSRKHRVTRHYRAPEWSEATNRNLFFYEVEVGAGRFLRIYAKTNQRIRLEVLHRMKRNGFQMEGGHTGTNWADLPRRVMSLASDAAELVNEALEHFQSVARIEPSGISPFQLLTEIAAEARKRDVAIFIVTILVQRGHIDAGQLPVPVSKAIQRMSQAGISQFNLKRNTYSLSVDRRYALQLLQTDGRWPNLSIRVRHRRRRG